MIKRELKVATLFIGLVFLSICFSSILFQNQIISIEDTTKTNLSTSDSSYIPKAPIISVSQIFEINDDYVGSSEGDDDNLIDAGETIEMRLELQNTGDQAITNVYGNITSTNTFVNLITYNQSFVEIAAGETGVSTSYFIIQFDSKLNVSDVIDFNINITATEGFWLDTFSITIMGVPNTEYLGHIVQSESNGDLNADDDYIIDPGEIISFRIYVENTGDSHHFGLEGYIETSDSYITVQDDYGIFGTIEANGDSDYAYFGITVSGACPLQHVVTFNFSLIDDFGHFWNSTFNLVMSGFPEYDLLDITYLEYTGDGDIYMDAGEYWYASIEIQNVGDAVGKSITVSLNSDDSFIDFYYIDRNISYDTIHAGFSDTKSSAGYWRFRISDQIVSGQEISFYINVSDDSGQAKQRFNVSTNVVGVSSYQITAFGLYSDCWYDTDCDGIIAAGDTFTPNITIVNNGTADGNYLEIYVYSSYKNLDFYYGNGSYYDLDSLEQNQPTSIVATYDWEFTLADKARKGDVVDITIIVIDSSQRSWTFTFYFTVEDGPIRLIFSPEGIFWIIGGTIFFGIFCIFPIIKKARAKKLGDEPTESWFAKQKRIHSKKKEERQKLRSQRLKEREVLRQQKERERIAKINENETQMLEKFENILEMTDRVEISMVAKSLGLKESQLFEQLIHWQDRLPFKIDGDYIEVEDADDFSDSIREKIAEMTKYYSCYNCGFPIERTVDNCPDCHKLITRCAVCKLPISFGDDIGVCKLCGTIGHLAHLQEWVKTQGKCPRCLQKLSVNDLEVVDSTDDKKK